MNDASSVGDEKPNGGLLANVSLLTTGGSTIQQLNHNDIQLLSNLNQNLSSTVENISKQKLQAKKDVAKVNTSTPAREANSGKIVYGFDLSPVHSFEMPYNSLTKKKLLESKSDNDVSKFSLQSHLEEQLFTATSSRSAPNFMQAPSVASSHQSRLSACKSDDAETMMSQVFSQRHDKKPINKHSKTSRKSLKGAKLSPPNRVSPRKSSKRYMHVQSSGYGISPWSTPSKLKVAEKRSNSPKKKERSSNADYLPDSALKLLANVKESKGDLKVYSKFEKTSGKTYKVSSSHRIIQERSPQKLRTSYPDLQSDTRNVEDQENTEYQTLKKRFDALEEENEKLKEGKDEAHKENFLLTAKLNKLVSVKESTDLKVKDSLNEDCKDAEITKLKKEIFEQERLLIGYQQENEKLYQEVSKLKIQQRENESAMYKENLKLKSQIASFKEEVNQKDAVIRDKNLLLLEKENGGQQTVNSFAQTLTESIRQAPTDLDGKKDEVIANLQHKLENFTIETQSLLLDKDNKLNEAGKNIKQLQEEVQNLRHELTLHNKNKKKQENEVVSDLKRQVKELETSLVRSQGKDHVTDVLYGNKERALLEEHCKQLEERLKTQEAQFSTNMRSLHDLYRNMNKDYENRVEDLSNQLELVKKNQMAKREKSEYHVEKHLQMQRENEHFKCEIERLNKELIEERKNKDLNNKTYRKPKLKSQLSANDQTYNPHFFVQHSSASEPSDNHLQTNRATQIEQLSIDS